MTNPSSLVIVYNPNGDWGGVYEDGNLVTFGHEYELMETALRKAGVVVRQVSRDVIMVGDDNRQVRETLAEVEEALDGS